MHLKNISQIGNLPQVGVKIKKIETTYNGIYTTWKVDGATPISLGL